MSREVSGTLSRQMRAMSVRHRQDGMLLRIRARHSGQYVRAVNDTMRVGDGLLQTYSSFSQAEEFLLTKAENTNGTDWYFIRSVSDPEKYLDVCSKEQTVMIARHYRQKWS